MSEFSLIDEPWIPVRFPDGRRAELGIRDTLFQAKEIATIEDQSPLVVAALHRLLLAVLYRALEGPTDIDEAKRLFRDGIPIGKVLDYLDKWRERFWLFHALYPFGQNPDARDSKIEPWTKLTAEFNDTSRKVLFDHTDTRVPVGCSPAACCRWLAATMNFSVSGGSGYRMSPEPNALFCIPIGADLRRTLILNLVEYPNHAVAEGDSALWERDAGPVQPRTRTRPARGYADLFTWQARMILLNRESDGTVRTMHFAAGIGFERSVALLDPMQSYIPAKEEGLLPIRLRPGRDPWRDFASLLPDPSGEGSRTIGNAWKLTGPGAGTTHCSVLVIGQRNEPPNATVDFWRMDQFVLPAEPGNSRSLRGKIESLLMVAEDVDRTLWKSCAGFARALLTHGDRNVDKKDLKNVVEQMGAGPLFWSTLEPRFHDVLDAHVRRADPEDVELQWTMDVHHALAQAWEEVLRTAGSGDAWVLRASAKAGRSVGNKLAELSAKVRSLQPKGDGA